MGSPSTTMEVTKTELGVLSTAPYCYSQNNGYPHGAHGFQQANYSAGFPYNHDEPNEYNRAYSAKHTYHDNMVPAGYTYAAHSGYAPGSGMFAYQGRHGSAHGGTAGMGQAFYGPQGAPTGYPYKYDTETTLSPATTEQDQAATLQPQATTALMAQAILPHTLRDTEQATAA